MVSYAAALRAALAAVADARALLLRECARPDGPRGAIDRCPADIEAEHLIRQHLLSACPAFGYIGEETDPQEPRQPDNPVWIVDPNDGTSSMQRGYRGHAISIGLVHHAIPVLGVVCAVDAPDDRGDLFVWAEGCGALRRNDVPVDRQPWSDKLEPDDVVGLSQGANRNPLGYAECVHPARFVGLPSIAYRLALVAVGECVATLSLNHLSVWDYAAGHALVRAAGGLVVDPDGIEIRYPWSDRSVTRRVFAGSPAVVRDLLERPWQRAPGSGFGDAAPPPELAPVRPRPGALVHDVSALRRAQGCLLGQLAGDALGALVEFTEAAEIARSYPSGGPDLLASGGPHDILAGQPTDDSELALCLARRLVVDRSFDQEHVVSAYAAWYHGWTHSEHPVTCGHRWCMPFDVGGTIARALDSVTPGDVTAGTGAERAIHAAHRQSEANGALMRVAPLGIWGAFRDPAEVATAARADAQLTHPHGVCQDSSAVFSVTIAAAIREGLDPRATHAFALEWAGLHQVVAPVVEAIEAAVDSPPPDFLSHQGWVLVALRNAFYRLLQTTSVEDGVIQTVRAGGDTDTNAAICGALLGAVFGRESIPEQWQKMVLTCRPMPGWPGVHQPRPAIYWPTDALVLAERLLTC